MATTSPSTPRRRRDRDRDPLLFFATSPFQTQLQASELMSTLPRSFNVEFFTADKSPSSPSTATQRSMTMGRRIIAAKRANRTSKSFDGGMIDGTKELSDIKILLGDLLKKVKTLEKSEQKHGDLCEKVKTLEERVMCLTDTVHGFEAEQDLYGGSRKNVVVGLISVFVVLLDNEIRRVLNKASSYEGFDVSTIYMGRDQTKPFKDNRDVTYTRCYWWHFYHHIFQIGMSFEDVWQERLGFKFESRHLLPPPQQWSITDESSGIARTLSKIMAIAEHAVVSVINSSIEDESKHVTVDELQETCGLYITILLQLRNLDAHLLQKAFGISFDWQPHRPRRGGDVSSSFQFEYKPLHLKVNEDHKVRARMVLEDILNHIDSLGDLDCIKTVIRGMALFLLACNNGQAAYPPSGADVGWFWSFMDESFTYIHKDGTLCEVDVSQEDVAAHVQAPSHDGKTNTSLWEVQEDVAAQAQAPSHLETCSKHQVFVAR